MVYVVRVGSTTTPRGVNLWNVECDDGPTWYFEIYLGGGPVRLTVSPPWRIHNGANCPGPTDGQCLAAGRATFVIVSTNDPSLPSRNVVIETSGSALTCP
jgi:hypothetical protein